MSTRKKKRKISFKAILAIFGILALAEIAATVYLLHRGGGTQAQSLAVQPTAAPTATPEPQPEITTLRFSATGDDLIHDGLYKQAAARATNGGYDFSYCYANVKDFYSGYNINWLNQETLITDAAAPAGYPCFATPTDIFPALYDTGFRVFNTSTNHSYDKLSLGISSTMDFWKSCPEDVYAMGFYDLNTYDNFCYQTVDDVTIGYLSYTEHTNGIPTPSDTQYGVVYTDQLDIMQQQIEAVRPNCDFLFVSMHWGVEGSHDTTDAQRQLAQQVFDWGADMIIGTHPHVVQDAQWMTAADGRSCLVAYSLGNFINLQASADNMIGAVLDVTLEKQVNPDGSVATALREPHLIPVISHYDSAFSNGRVYMYRDYTEELAAAHGVRAYSSGFSLEYIRSVLEENISPEFLQLA